MSCAAFMQEGAQRRVTFPREPAQKQMLAHPSKSPGNSVSQVETWDGDLKNIG